MFFVVFLVYYRMYVLCCFSLYTLIVFYVVVPCILLIVCMVCVVLCILLIVFYFVVPCILLNVLCFVLFHEYFLSCVSVLCCCSLYTSYRVCACFVLLFLVYFLSCILCCSVYNSYCVCILWFVPCILLIVCVPVLCFSCFRYGLTSVYVPVDMQTGSCAIPEEVCEVGM
jgi:hypothetical protein